VNTVLQKSSLMKKFLLLAWCICVVTSTRAQNTDLPTPSANLQTLPAGSYVIAMDNTLQVNSAGDFNLKAYGLIVYLLNNNIRIKWCIKAGKAKDGFDFTATAEQVKPTLVAGGTSRNFKAGPFIVNVTDTSGVSALVDAFYTANSLTGQNRPQLYRLTADALNVDIRYDLVGFRPKAAILTDGGNQNIHLAYMTAAAIPSTSYATSAGTDLLTNCFTFASEPHNNKTGTAVNNAISAIRAFVTEGGNFLAQCDAIDNYENNSLGRFQTTSGITITNTNIGTNLTYANPDLSFSQYEGAYNASQGGSVKNWKIIGSSTNNEHDHATGTGSNANVIGASVAKLYYNKGGLVFYIGNHSFSTGSSTEINGIRMYMNAFLTPSNTNCPALVFMPLPIKLLNFSVSKHDKKTALSWTVNQNDLADRFELEKSPDGRNFISCAVVSPTRKGGNETYQFLEQPSATKVFFRLKIVDKNSKEQYSDMVSTHNEKDNQEQLIIFENPAKGNWKIGYNSQKNSAIDLHIYNYLGTLLYSAKINSTEGINLITVPAKFTKEKGSYYIEVIENGVKRLVSKAEHL
jgi:hypothetical protein